MLQVRISLHFTDFTHESKLTYGKHAFAHSAAELWNNLPINVHKSLCVVTFEKKLKTNLFPKK